MRRFWVILMAISALSLIACDGGKSSKGDRSDKKRQEKTESAMPEYKQKALDYAIAVYEAEEMGDECQMSEISVDIAKYVATLSNKHRKIFEKTYKEQYDLLANSESYLSDMTARDERGGRKSAHQNTYEKDFVESERGLNMRMVYVEGGTFTMGASEYDSEAYGREKPAHQVTLSPFYIAECEVTQYQWRKIMGSTVYDQKELSGDSAKYGVGDDYPMCYVSYEDAKAFCRELSLLTGRTYVLPTEAQWEFAAYGGVNSAGYKYSGGHSINDVAWYGDNSGSTTHPVGQKLSNELGLYDMCGNIYEWCSDWQGSYSDESLFNPVGPNGGEWKVLRGGCWASVAGNCRITSRGNSSPSSRNNIIGFRVVCLP
ncbi:MAG: formylglycine-generating enzyme family protein [Alistipes sp.]|nr:formylglycine-generating enzyme family protein [Alistipes sp.]